MNSNKRLLTEKEILSCPHPTATYERDDEAGINRLIGVDMVGILQAQDAKTLSALSEGEIKERLTEWVTDYKNAAERNALAEDPDESAAYLTSLFNARLEKALKEQAEEFFRWLMLFAASSDPMIESIPMYGGKAQRKLCHRFRIPVEDIAFKKQVLEQ